MEEFDFDEYIKDFFKYETSKSLKDCWKHTYEQMAVHTRKLEPKELLTAARPNEEKKITQYRIANYRPITYGVVNKSIDDVYRAVGGINYSIEGLADNVKSYIGGNNFDNYNFETYVQKKVLRRDIEDPNGFLLWLPDGAGLAADNQSISPKPYLFYSDQLFYTDWVNVASFLSCETNMIKHENQYSEGKVYYILTTEKFYKLIQVDIGDRYEDYELVEIYAHNIGEMPFLVLGGDVNDNNYFNSFFSAFLAFGDESIRQFSDWQAIMVTCGFPLIEEFVQDCDIIVHSRQANPIPENEEKFEGIVRTRSEKTIHKSPLGITERKIPGKNAAFDETLDASIPSRRYIAPPIEVAQEAKKSWKDCLEMAESALNQSISYAGDSGKKVELTNEGKYSMLTKIYNNYYDNIFRRSFIFIQAYITRARAESIKISINKPETVSMNSRQDILDEISVLKSENAPNMLVAERTKDLAKKMYSGNPLAQKIFDVITIIDPLFTYSISEKTSLQLANDISQLALVTSVNAYGVLSDIAYQKTPKWFIEAPIKEIRDIFDVEIQKYMPAPPEVITDNNGNINA